MNKLLTVATLVFLGACSTSSDNTGGGGGGGGTFDATRYVGNWTGTWTNTTFSSTGSAAITVAQNGSSYTLTIDLGGNVFGGGDPAPENLTATIGTSSATLTAQTSATYGELTATLNADGTVTVNGNNISVGSVRSFTLTGTWSASQIQVDVTINFASGPPAQATGTLTKQ